MRNPEPWEEAYRDRWIISPAYIGFDGVHDDYDAWCDPGENWRDNGMAVRGATIEEVKQLIDEWYEDR